jgi:hypothetical protein
LFCATVVSFKAVELRLCRSLGSGRHVDQGGLAIERQQHLVAQNAGDTVSMSQMIPRSRRISSSQKVTNFFPVDSRLLIGDDEEADADVGGQLPAISAPPALQFGRSNRIHTASSLRIPVTVIGAADVAGAAGAAAVERLVHRLQHLRVLAHAEIIVGAPHHDVAAAARTAIDRTGKRSCLAFEIGDTR